MTHLVWRNGWAYFRLKLPEDLAGKPVPRAWPEDLRTLVNEQLGTFKREIWKSLKLAKKDEQRAKRIVANRVAETTGFIEEARRLLERGSLTSLSAEEIAGIAARVHADRLAQDEELRRNGIGLRLPRLGDLLAIPSPTSEAPPLQPDDPGLTEDDLHLLRSVAEKVRQETQEAVARMRPTAPVRRRVSEELSKRGAEPTAEERRKIEFEVLKAELRAWNDIRARLDGEIIPTPVIEESPSGGQDPTLKHAFTRWKDGAGARGGKQRSPNTADEAEVAVRRFTELHGNIHVSSIKKAQVRSFRDAMIKLPKHLLPRDNQGETAYCLIRRCSQTLMPLPH